MHALGRSNRSMRRQRWRADASALRSGKAGSCRCAGLAAAAGSRWRARQTIDMRMGLSIIFCLCACSADTKSHGQSVLRQLPRGASPATVSAANRQKKAFSLCARSMHIHPTFPGAAVMFASPRFHHRTFRCPRSDALETTAQPGDAGGMSFRLNDALAPGISRARAAVHVGRADVRAGDRSIATVGHKP